MKDEKAGEELERMWKKWPWPNLKYYPGIYLEEIRKNTWRTSVRIAGLRDKIWTRKLPNTN
jgi:hypothetical protein